MAFVVAFLALSVIADKSAMFVGLSLVGWERPRIDARSCPSNEVFRPRLERGSEVAAAP